jgi:arginine exporter protein ArgO
LDLSLNSFKALIEHISRLEPVVQVLFGSLAIAYGAKLLTPIMQKPRHWRILDSLIAIIMFIIAINLASQGGWI